MLFAKDVEDVVVGIWFDEEKTAVTERDVTMIISSGKDRLQIPLAKAARVLEEGLLMVRVLEKLAAARLTPEEHKVT